MNNQYPVTITNGRGTVNLAPGTYDAVANVAGYDNSTLSPTSVTIASGTDSYAFTIAASGTLTLVVTNTGTSTGVPIEGAVFYRTDATGTKYGDPITTNANGVAVFNNVPFASTNAPRIYFIQESSDAQHTFNDEVQYVTMTSSTLRYYIANPDAQTSNITLTDANYDGLPIASGTITLV